MHAHLFRIWDCCHSVYWLPRLPVRSFCPDPQWREEMSLIGRYELWIKRVLEVCRGLGDDGKLAAPLGARRRLESLQRRGRPV